MASRTTQPSSTSRTASSIPRTTETRQSAQPTASRAAVTTTKTVSRQPTTNRSTSTAGSALPRPPTAVSSQQTTTTSQSSDAGNVNNAATVAHRRTTQSTTSSTSTKPVRVVKRVVVKKRAAGSPTPAVSIQQHPPNNSPSPSSSSTPRSPSTGATQPSAPPPTPPASQPAAPLTQPTSSADPSAPPTTTPKKRVIKRTVIVKKKSSASRTNTTTAATGPAASTNRRRPSTGNITGRCSAPSSPRAAASTSVAIATTPSSATATTTSDPALPKQAASAAAPSASANATAPARRVVRRTIVKAAPSGRRAPTKNPLEVRTQLEAKAAANATTTATNNSSALPANGGRPASTYITRTLSGYGVLAAADAKNSAKTKPAGRMRTAAAGSVKSAASPTRETPEKPTLLIEVRGRRRVIPRLVEPTAASLDHGHVYILVAGAALPGQLYLWTGRRANRIERARGVDLIHRMKAKDFRGRAVVDEVDDGKEPDAFWRVLGCHGNGSALVVRSSEDDPNIDKQKAFEKVFLVSEKTVEGKGVVATAKPLTGFKKSAPSRALLTSDSCFLLDGGVYAPGDVYVWCGRGVRESTRRAAMLKAKQLVSERPAWVTVTRILEGAEPVLFREKFADWGDLPIAVQPTGGDAGAKIAQRPPPQKTVGVYDVSTMFAPPQPKVPLAAASANSHRNADLIDQLAQHSEWRVAVWRVREFDKESVDPVDICGGHFYAGESYVVLYSYRIKNRDEHKIFFWQGRNSTITEKGCSAVLTIDLGDMLGGAQHIRVVQHREPPALFHLFGGVVIVHRGTFENRTLRRPMLYQVRVAGPVATASGGVGIRAVEVATSPSSLFAMDTFLLLSPHGRHHYLWKGRYAVSTSVDAAVATFARLQRYFGDSRDVEIVEEGREPTGFWTLLGGHASPRLSPADTPLTAVRLFQCSKASGTFVVEEIGAGYHGNPPTASFCQDDLVDDDMFILDACNVVFVWQGTKATQEERRVTLQIAVDYVGNHPDGRASRNENFPIYLVMSKEEPLEFTCYFHGWDHSKAKTPPTEVRSLRSVREALAEYTREYTLEELIERPKHLDVTRLEFYLSDAEFERLFGMSKEAYQKQPEWRQQQQKKSIGLY